MADAAVRRCAIYTRKSSEEGLEQDYNSLHAQREACEAFVRSQAGEGWKLIRTAYDDGGSGPIAGPGPQFDFNRADYFAAFTLRVRTAF
jgi:Resolvase, N terminal domain